MDHFLNKPSEDKLPEPRQNDRNLQYMIRHFTRKSSGDEPSELQSKEVFQHMMHQFLSKSPGENQPDPQPRYGFRAIREDSHVRWKGNWAHPKTCREAFLLAITSTPAVAKAFPHTYLAPWRTQDLCRRMKDAIKALELLKYSLACPPEEFIPSMFQGDRYLHSSNYKIVTTWIS